MEEGGLYNNIVCDGLIHGVEYFKEKVGLEGCKTSL